MQTLAQWGLSLEDHYHTPQDVEWVLDQDDRLWIVQSRALANIEPGRREVASRDLRWSRARKAGVPSIPARPRAAPSW